MVSYKLGGYTIQYWGNVCFFTPNPEWANLFISSKNYRTARSHGRVWFLRLEQKKDCTLLYKNFNQDWSSPVLLFSYLSRRWLRFCWRKRNQNRFLNAYGFLIFATENHRCILFSSFAHFIIAKDKASASILHLTRISITTITSWAP